MRKKTVPLEFDKLRMYFGEPYLIDLDGVDGQVTVYQPTIGNIIEIGEKEFYKTLNVFVTNTTANRLQLWKSGYDWNEMTDYELFRLIYPTSNPNILKLLFGDLKFFDDEGNLLFKEYELNVDDVNTITLYSQSQGIEINENVYNHISQYLRNVFNIFPEEKFTKSKTMKEWYIEADEKQHQNDLEKAKKGNDESYSIQSLISSCINHPGFKYKLEDLKNVGICQFMDSVKRLQIYESSTALMKGMYSGFIDGKSIDPEAYNFMKTID